MSAVPKTTDPILYYASRGWQVFPIHNPIPSGGCDCGNPSCKQIAKHPRTINGLKDATTDPKKIIAWRQQYPYTNWAIRTGAESGIIVLDVDVKNDGEKSLDELTLDHAMLPATVEAQTGSGGRHIYFRHPGVEVKNSTSKLGHGLDIRGDGGYVCAPPSEHASGKHYEWELSSKPSTTPLAPIPEWMLSLLETKPSPKLNGHTVLPQGPLVFREGERNSGLASLGGVLRKKGVAVEAIAGALHAMNGVHCVPPLEPTEVEKVAQSMGRYDPDPLVTSQTMETEPFLEREGDAYYWLWPSIGIGIGFDYLRETYRGLQGEVSVQTIKQIEGGERQGHIHQGRLDLSDTSARERLANVLRNRREGIDWAGMIEIACHRTVDAWREGEPVVNLANLSFEADERFAVSKLLPQGETTVFYADGGTGKSYVALALGIAIRVGVSLPSGLRPEMTGNVLVLDWETNAKEHAKRVAWLAKGFGINPPEIYYRAMRRSIVEDAATIRKFISRYSVALVIVDSLGSACGGEPENAETMLRAFESLRSFHPATRLVITHISHAGAEQKGSAHAFGSRYVHNMARSLWELRRGGEADSHINVGFYHRKVNSGPLLKPFGLRLRFEKEQRLVRLEAIDVMEEPELSAHASLGQRIRAALRQGEKTYKQIAEQLNVQENSLRSAVRRMADVENVDGGGGRGNPARLRLLTERDEERG